MIQQIIENYLSVKTQKIEIDLSGKIIMSNNELFPVKKAKTIYEIHPFFEIFDDILQGTSDQETFKIIQLEIDGVDLIVDILFNRGDKKQNPLLLIFDKSEYYKEIQEVTQDKNDLFISNFWGNEKFIL